MTQVWCPWTHHNSHNPFFVGYFQCSYDKVVFSFQNKKGIFRKGPNFICSCKYASRWNKFWTIKRSLFNSHLSDFLRQLLLYQVGGIYMDNDIITLRKIPKSLEDSNYLFFAAPGKVGSAIMKFQQGHSFLRQSILQAVRLFQFLLGLTSPKNISSTGSKLYWKVLGWDWTHTIHIIGPKQLSSISE